MGDRKDGSDQEFILNEMDARIQRAFAAPPKPVTDLESPLPLGAQIDREGKDIAPHVLPQIRNSEQLVAGGINDGIDASSIADHLHRNPDQSSKNLPEGWRLVTHPEMAGDMKKAGAYHLMSPAGMQYVAFGSSAAKRSPLESMKQAFGLSDKAAAAARIGAALSDNYEVTYAGKGRGGALAKVASEAASTWLPGVHDSVRPKTCVAIDATSVPPATYKALGLAERGHARTTVAVSRTTDELGRFKHMFAKSNDVRVKERPDDRKVVGGPRDGARRDATGSIFHDGQEHTAHTDLKIILNGSVKLDEAREHTFGTGPGRRGASKHSADEIGGHVKDDLVRKHLLAAKRGDATRGGRSPELSGKYR